MIKQLCNWSLPPEVILCLGCILDRCYIIMFQAFIFNRKCLEAVTASGQYVQSVQNTDWICTVGIKNASLTLSLELQVSSATSHWVVFSSLARFVPALITSGIIGSIGDLYSRKLALMIPTVGFHAACLD